MTAQEIVTTIQKEQQAGASVLGEIITWSVHLKGKRVHFTNIAQALIAAGLKAGYARELCKRHAFARACRELDTQRIIRVVKEEGEEMVFQFTAEKKSDSAAQFEYALETMLTLNKVTGEITCEKAEIAEQAKQLLDAAVTNRSASDITSIVQRLFAEKADLFPVRDQGGAYFVPEQHLSFVDQVEKFLTALGGNMNRFPVPKGTVRGNAAVKDVIASGLADVIAKHVKNIDKFGEETGEKAITTQAEKIKKTRFKIECYAAYLEEKQGWLKEQLAVADHTLRSKFGRLCQKLEAA